MRNELEQIRNRRWRWPAMALLLGAVALLVAACGGSDDASDEVEQRVDVVRGDIEIAVSASGNVSFPRRRSLTFGSAGSVEQVMVDEGDRVRAGQTLAMLESNDLEQAVIVLRKGIELAPQQYELVSNLALILATGPDLGIRRPQEAIDMMKRVCAETQDRDPRYLHTLSVALAGSRRWEEAVEAAETARRIASSKPEYAGLVPSIGQSLVLFRTNMKAAGQ